MKEETITIDITPTWAGILPVLVNTFNNSKGSRDELYRLAEFADKTLPAALQRCKELESAIEDYIKHIRSMPDDTEKTHHLSLALNNRAGERLCELVGEEP
jgi:hypothetical protein